DPVGIGAAADAAVHPDPEIPYAWLSDDACDLEIPLHRSRQMRNVLQCERLDRRSRSETAIDLTVEGGAQAAGAQRQKPECDAGERDEIGERAEPGIGPGCND